MRAEFAAIITTDPIRADTDQSRLVDEGLTARTISDLPHHYIMIQYEGEPNKETGEFPGDRIAARLGLEILR